MAFRVYDTKKKQWIHDNVYMNSNGDLFKIKQSLFGMVRVPLALDSERYIVHESIGLLDKNNKAVYVGDYIRANVGKTEESNEDKIEIGLVAYAHELSAYVILCVNSDTFYTLGSQVCEYIEIIGNTFDGYKE